MAEYAILLYAPVPDVEAEPGVTPFSSTAAVSRCGQSRDDRAS
jgi:hypothetical protein